ncbi:MAG: histone deacetylase family protein [Candidatus Coatesbacteria bacterium]
MAGTTVGLATAPACLAHRAGDAHPERPARLEAILGRLAEEGLRPRMRELPPRAATTEDLALCHTAGHIAKVHDACLASLPLDPQTTPVPASWDAALFAAGAGLAAAEAIVAGEVTRAFCAVRPPGHHAGPDSSAGFCLFNNVGIAARHCQRRLGIPRVAIVDFDVHHCDGTQGIFWADGTVLVASIHQYGANPLNPAVPFYPGSGAETETGGGPGTGCIFNAPVPPGAGLGDYEEAILERFTPAIEAFRPGILLVSAGFDGHRDDPLALMDLSTEDYGLITRLIVGIADRVCQGRVLSMLEGGYHLEALASAATAHVKALME